MRSSGIDHLLKYLSTFSTSACGGEAKPRSQPKNIHMELQNHFIVDTPFDPHKHLCVPDLKYRTASFLCYMEDVCFTLTLNHYYRLKDVSFYF